MNKCVLGVLASITMAGAASAQVVVSENFENGPGVFTQIGNVALATGATYQPCCGTPADTTNTFAAFGGGDEATGSLSTLFNTSLGTNYNVMFDFGALGAGNETITFLVGGTPFTFNATADNSLTTTFQPGAFTFAGLGGQTAFSIFSSGGDNVDGIVDNVSVTAAVPEPATWAMMLLGFGGIGLTMRRRRGSGRDMFVQAA